MPLRCFKHRFQRSPYWWYFIPDNYQSVLYRFIWALNRMYCFGSF